jgi:hypothetical protein
MNLLEQENKYLKKENEKLRKVVDLVKIWMFTWYPSDIFETLPNDLNEILKSLKELEILNSLKKLEG